MKKLWTEFKAFIAKGDVLNLAVAVIIGGAFNKIVSSLVNDIIMPLVSLCVGGRDVTDWKWVIREAQYDANGKVLVAESALKYGVFIQTVVDFLIIALTVFIIFKIFKASRERIHVISQKVIAETKELTKKQLKALKKLQKKAKKNGEEVEVENLVQQVTGEKIAEQKTDSSQLTTNSGKQEPMVEKMETIVDDNVQLSKNEEMLNVLKEIRDSLKSSKPKKESKK